MKLDRLIGILSLLLQKDRITTAELAERFEVSRRTVMRDIEAINAAGIPIASEKGRGGGIYIMSGYKLDRTALSKEEMKSILSGLQSLDSVSGTNRYKLLMSKLSADSVNVNNCGDNIIIDLGGWDNTGVSKKIELIKSAMESNKTISFSYCAPGGDSSREIEPYRLIFQWSGWYVWGYCLMREDYRMFKLSRLSELTKTEKEREERDVPEYVCDKLNHSEGEIKATVEFDKTVRWRVAEEFGGDKVVVHKNGNTEQTFTWSDLPSFFQHILAFGDKAEIKAPEKYRKEFKKLVKKIYDKY